MLSYTREPVFLKADRRQLAAWIGLIVWSGLLALIAYGDSLTLPFLADDFFHLPYVDSHSLAEIWQTAEGLYYFRPLSFAVWKVLYLLLGRHDPFALHAVNLLLHWSNGLMVAWLAGQLWASTDRRQPMGLALRSPRPEGAGSAAEGWYRRYLSATLFLLFPFSYQAVPWIGALVHPFVTTSVLLSLLSYVKMQATRRRAWGVLSLGFALLSPLVHEYGLVIGPLIAAIEITQPVRSDPLWHGLRRAATWTLPALAWLFLSRSVPTVSGIDNLALATGRNIVRNSIYVLQAVAYPLTWLGGWLRDSLGIDQLLASSALSILTVAGSAIVQWRTGAGKRAWLPWLWIGVVASPAILGLSFRYVTGAPRLLVLISVAVSWLWADVFLRVVAWSQATRLRLQPGVLVAATLCTIVLAQNLSFIRDRMHLYQLGGSVVNQVALASAAPDGSGRATIFVNLPAWIAPPQSTYAIGSEGVLFLPEYAPLEMVSGVYTGHPAAASAARFDAVQPATPYYVGLRGSDPQWSDASKSGGQVFVTRYTTDTVSLQSAGELGVAASPDQAIALFETSATLRHASANLSAAGLAIDLTWQVHEPPPPDVTVFVHVFDENGQLVAQADGDPFAGTYPFWQWPRESIVLDRRLIEIGGSGLSLRVGLYDRASGRRLEATSNAGIPLADNSAPIPIQPTTTP